MAYDGLIEFGGEEFINLSRTAQLASTLGIDTLWTDPDSVQWIQDGLAGVGYDLIGAAPWYDAGVPASMEFAGIVPLSLTGLDDSTLESTTIEYNTSGGSSGRGRSKTLPIVANVALIASTERGADFGKRWMDRRLVAAGARTFCSGSDLRYFQYKQGEGETTPPLVHRRDVTLTRGSSVTRKRSASCSATWLVTFTWTANDPFEYGEEVPRVADLGGALTAPAGAPALLSSGSLALTEQGCPEYDYSPIYDPLYPALVASPTAPDFYPAGWDLRDGVTFDRFWTRVAPVEPSGLHVVPVVTLTADVAARFVRVSIWGSDSEVDDQCEPLWTATVSYLPAGLDFVIDGEQEASYAWNGISPRINRTDSLVYGAGARPIQWTKFNDPTNLLITLDILDDAGSGDYDGNGTVRAAVSFVPKSD